MSPQKARIQSGQALLIVLLSMAVVLTIVLSVLSSSVTDIAVTSRGEESIRAFSAAEAGVEQAIIGAPQTGDFEGSSFEAEVVEVGENLNNFLYPLEVAYGDTATVWFASHDEDGNLDCSGSSPCFSGQNMRICWGENVTYPNANLIPAIELSVLYLRNPGVPTTAQIARAAYDPNISRRAQNLFVDGVVTNGCSISGKSFAFSANINLSTLPIPASAFASDGLQFATLRFLYNHDQTHPFGVSTTSATAFPSQGQKIQSTGKSGEAVRRVEALRLYSDIPPIFSSVLFTPNGITK